MDRDIDFKQANIYGLCNSSKYEKAKKEGE